MTPQRHPWVMVGFWLILTVAAIGFLVTSVGSARALLALLLIAVLGQLGYGVLCRRIGKCGARLVYRFVPVLLFPGMVFLRGSASDLLTVTFDMCQLLATLDWSDDDIGGWGRRRWAQVKQAARRFSRPVMGGLVP
ncbi:hypothetical protein DGo_PB0274 (plasmid) [Deinococcus gobiensis I-0]|uniref:Uncharacterized protein n=2 Tax=Deinococcus TaxID=1298 RepID=H8H1Z6_DEIGI|nr:hypothetical protein DGo_PB0274 [Deinococcus gobiensis I-0]